MMVRRTFTREFKMDVCRQVVDGEVSKSQIKRQHNIGNATLDRWISQFMARVPRVSPLHHPGSSNCRPGHVGAWGASLPLELSRHKLPTVGSLA